METFTLDPCCWRVGRLFCRNPLLRKADRIEALVILVALVVSLAAIPVAGVAGAVVYGVCHSRYAQEADQRHTVVATVTATGIDSVDASLVQASWPVAVGERSGPIEVTTAAKVGQGVRIWIDKAGNPADPPTPSGRAVADAFATVLSIMLTIGLGMTSLVTGTCSRLDRARDVEWEREIRCLQEDGGRTNQY